MNETKRIGEWYTVTKDNKNYNVLIQKNDGGSIIVMDENFVKIPYEEWDGFEFIMEEYFNDQHIRCVICYGNDDKPKGFMTEKEFNNFSGHRWWIRHTYVNIPRYRWENCHIGNVESFL
jgi:hypothetical protein